MAVKLLTNRIAPELPHADEYLTELKGCAKPVRALICTLILTARKVLLAAADREGVPPRMRMISEGFYPDKQAAISWVLQAADVHLAYMEAEAATLDQKRLTDSALMNLTQRAHTALRRNLNVFNMLTGHMVAVYAYTNNFTTDSWVEKYLPAGEQAFAKRILRPVTMPKIIHNFKAMLSAKDEPWVDREALRQDDEILDEQLDMVFNGLGDDGDFDDVIEKPDWELWPDMLLTDELAGPEEVIGLVALLPKRQRATVIWALSTMLDRILATGDPETLCERFVAAGAPEEQADLLEGQITSIEMVMPFLVTLADPAKYNFMTKTHEETVDAIYERFFETVQNLEDNRLSDLLEQVIAAFLLAVRGGLDTAVEIAADGEPESTRNALYEAFTVLKHLTGLADAAGDDYTEIEMQAAKFSKDWKAFAAAADPAYAAAVAWMLARITLMFRACYENAEAVSDAFGGGAENMADTDNYPLDPVLISCIIGWAQEAEKVAGDEVPALVRATVTDMYVDFDELDVLSCRIAEDTYRVIQKLEPDNRVRWQEMLSFLGALATMTLVTSTDTGDINGTDDCSVRLEASGLMANDGAALCWTACLWINQMTTLIRAGGPEILEERAAHGRVN